jgi:hypothetical protein
MVGFRGSLARGTKGPHKGFAAFDPNDFDVDAFIASDRLAGQIPKVRGFRSGGRFDEFARIQRSIDAALRDEPEFGGLRSGRFTFRVFSTAEVQRLLENGDNQIVMTPK